MERLSDRLVQIRKFRSMSARKVALKVGVPTSTYRAWEAGRAIQGPEAFVKLAKVLSVSLAELMTGKASEAATIIVRLEAIEREIGQVRSDLLLFI